jgi:DNA-binding protein H-NS
LLDLHLFCHSSIFLNTPPKAVKRTTERWEEEDMKKPKFELTSLDVDQLVELRQKLEAELENRIATQRQKLESQLQALAALQPNRPAAQTNRGAAASSSMPMRARRTSALKGRPATPKYRGPGGETWAGRGLAPRWLTALEKKGKKRETFLIKP